MGNKVDGKMVIEYIRKMIEGEFPHPRVADLIGFRLDSVDEGEVVISLEAKEHHFNPMGTLHGGIICDIADSAMGMAFATTLKEGETYASVELKMNFVRPFWTGKLLARANVVTRGKIVGIVDCEVADEGGKLIARGSSTMMVLDGERGENRGIG